jgi:hypothetical protein
MYPSVCFGSLSKRSKILLYLIIAVGIVHHSDHVLRVDHSGWPFRPEVNPFTYSLLAYPILLFALAGPPRFFWARWSLLLLGVMFTLFAHIFIETPAMQYAMWAHNHSIDPHDQGSHNLLSARSTSLGLAAVIVALTLNVLLVSGCISMLWDGLRARPSHPRNRELPY